MTRRSLFVTVGAAAALVMSLVLAPRTIAAEPSQPPPAFFGTWSDGMSIAEQQSRGASQARLDDVRANGAGLVRQYIWWDRIEKDPVNHPGVYEWGVLDDLVQDATARGVSILPTLLYTPAAYSSDPDPNDSPLYPPDDPQKLADFAAALVERYGTNGEFWNCMDLSDLGLGWRCDEPYNPILMWEVWNEPDHPSWWKGDPDPAEYLDLLKPVHAAIKGADPEAQVVLGSMTNAGGGLSDGYLNQLYELGAKDYFDVIALNAYARDVGAMMAFIHGTRDVATEQGDGAKPMLITEYGWATSPNNTSYINTSASCQAALLHASTRELASRRTELGLIGAIQFQWQDVPTESSAWPHHAGMRYADGSEKPSLNAYAAAIAGEAPPAGADIDACPEDQRSMDGKLQRVTVAKSGTGTGVVYTASPTTGNQTKSGGIDCGSDCTQQFQPGMTVTLKAVPDSGSYLARWTGVNCKGEICQFTATDSTNDVEVVFERVSSAERYEEDSTRLTYTGAWATRGSTADSGGAVARTGAGPAGVKIEFTGTGVRWLSRKGPTSGIARVLIDGVRVAMVDLYSATTRYQRRVFDSAELSYGNHTAEIQWTGRKDARARDDLVWLDAFVVR